MGPGARRGAAGARPARTRQGAPLGAPRDARRRSGWPSWRAIFAARSGRSRGRTSSAWTRTGNVVVYQGVPWDLGGGVHLYRARYVSQLQAVQLTPAERASLFDHELVLVRLAPATG